MLNLPFYRRMQANRAGDTSFVASKLVTHASGNGTTLSLIDQAMTWNGLDWVSGTSLELFRFSGTIPIAAGNGVQYGTTVSGVNAGVGVSLNSASLQTIGGNGLKFLFGGELPAPSYPGALITNLSPVVSGIADTSGIRKNMRVLGTGIASGALVSVVNPGSGFTMTLNATTGPSTTVYLTGMQLTAGSTAGVASLFNTGSSTIGTNTGDLAGGMSVVGAPALLTNANDHLVMQVPAGVVTPGAKLRLDYTFSNIYSSGASPSNYTNANLNSVIAVHPIGASNQGTNGLTAAIHTIGVTVGPASKFSTSHYLEIQFLDNVGQFTYDGETGSSGARLVGYAGAPINDFAGAMDIVFRPYFTGNDPGHAMAQLTYASLVVHY